MLTFGNIPMQLTRIRKISALFGFALALLAPMGATAQGGSAGFWLADPCYGVALIPANLVQVWLMPVQLAELLPAAAPRVEDSGGMSQVRQPEATQMLVMAQPVYRERIQPFAPDRDVNPMGGQLPGSRPQEDRDSARVVPPLAESQRSIITPAPEHGLTQSGRPCDIQPHIEAATETPLAINPERGAE